MDRSEHRRSQKRTSGEHFSILKKDTVSLSIATSLAEFVARGAAGACLIGPVAVHACLHLHRHGWFCNHVLRSDFTMARPTTHVCRSVSLVTEEHEIRQPINRRGR